MVAQEKIERIVTLVQTMGSNGDCALYFPKKVGESKKYGDITVKLVHEDPLEDYTIRREFALSDSNSQMEISTVEHFHFTGWEDW